MATRNITLNLPVELIRKTKVRAAERGQSMSSFVREMLEETVSPHSRSRTSGSRFVELAKHGPSSHVDVSTIRREDLHDDI